MRNALNQWKGVVFWGECKVNIEYKALYHLFATNTWKLQHEGTGNRMMDKIQTAIKMAKRKRQPKSRINNDIFIAKMFNLVDFNFSWFQKQF